MNFDKFIDSLSEFESLELLRKLTLRLLDRQEVKEEKRGRPRNKEIQRELIKDFLKRLKVSGISIPGRVGWGLKMIESEELLNIKYTDEVTWDSWRVQKGLGLQSWRQFLHLREENPNYLD